MIKPYLFVLLPLIGISCLDYDRSDFRLEYFMDFQIQPDGNLLTTKVFSQILDSEWVKFLNQNGLTDDMIASVRPSALRVEPIFAEQINYDFVSRARAAIFTPHKPHTYLPIGEVLPEPGDAPHRLNIFPGLADVRDIIDKGEFVLELALDYRFVVGSFSDHRFTVVFDVFLK